MSRFDSGWSTHIHASHGLPITSVCCLRMLEYTTYCPLPVSRDWQPSRVVAPALSRNVCTVIRLNLVTGYFSHRNLVHAHHRRCNHLVGLYRGGRRHSNMALDETSEPVQCQSIQQCTNGSAFPLRFCSCLLEILSSLCQAYHYRRRRAENRPLFDPQAVGQRENEGLASRSGTAEGTGRHLVGNPCRAW